jgi:FAD-dependent oxidoreductase domain-containing protein 1
MVTHSTVSAKNGKVVIVGGGVMGAATACFLARDHVVQATVLERDPSYQRASSSLSASSIRQQFSQEVNIRLSLWSLAFLRRIAEELAVHDHMPHIGLTEPGYLYLGHLANAPGQALMRQLHSLQRQNGADTALFTAAELHTRFDWLHTADLALGSLGLTGEGWFDGPALMQAFKRKAVACGARFVADEAQGFDTRAGHISAVLGRSGTAYTGDATVLCAGAWVAPLAAQLGVVLPVVAKKRDVFVFDSPQATPGCPLVIDTSGLWFRPEGQGFICGAPPRDGDPDEPPLSAIDHGLFDQVLWPALAHRVPGFEALRLRAAWAGYYEMNTFDHNGLVGALPGWHNTFTACGFSGHGMQQAPAVGAALAALIVGAQSTAPDLTALSPARLLRGEPLLEANVI